MEERYSRQILFAGIGSAGQEKLRDSRVLLIGCGALGSVLSEILVRAGIGRLILVDRDYVDESNLQRQSLYTEEDVRTALPKAVAASRHLGEINSGVRLEPRVVDVNASTIESLIQNMDLILDGTDNFETRYLINDASQKWDKPWVYGACVGAYGLSVAFLPGRTPCLRCILEHLPPPGSSPTCDTSGIIGPIVHLVAALQSAEALKILTGRLQQLSGKLISMDIWENQILSLDLEGFERDPNCRACGRGEFEFLAGEHEGRGQYLCGRDAVQIRRNRATGIDLATVAGRLDRLGEVTCNEFLLRAFIEGYEIVLFADGRGIVRGTQDVDEAKRIFARYVGN